MSASFTVISSFLPDPGKLGCDLYGKTQGCFLMLLCTLLCFSKKKSKKTRHIRFACANEFLLRFRTRMVRYALLTKRFCMSLKDMKHLMTMMQGISQLWLMNSNEIAVK
jgi:hypothetical protein